VLQALSERGVAATLHVVGDGPDLEDLQARSHSARASGDILFHGWQVDPWGMVPSTAIVIIPSLYESMCIVAREAMIRCIRVVASPIPVFHEWIPASLIVEDFSVAAFVNGVLEVNAIPTPTIESLYEKALRRFSDEVFIERHTAHGSRNL